MVVNYNYTSIFNAGNRPDVPTANGSSQVEFLSNKNDLGLAKKFYFEASLAQASIIEKYKNMFVNSRHISKHLYPRM